MPSQIKAVSAPDAPKPAGKYSHAIISGNQVHIAGQLGQLPATGEIVEGGIEAQVDQTIRNVEAVLKAAGTDLSRIISRKVYVTDIHAHVPAVSAAWTRVLSEPYPASTTVQVGGLALKGALIEIDCIAELPE